MRRPDLIRRLTALALFAAACAVSPSVRELVGGRPFSAPAPMSLLSFCLAVIALALVIRSAIGERKRSVRTPPGRPGERAPADHR